MKRQLLVRAVVTRLSLLAAILVMILSGCQKDLYDPTVLGDDGKVTIDNYYDFATTKSVQLNLSYGTDCPKAYFEVYAENPLIYQEEGGQIIKKKDILNIAGGFADANGKYSATAVLPAGVSEVYIYSPDFGVPTLFKAQVTNSAISADITFENQFDVTASSSTRAVQTRGNANIAKSYQTLGNWDSNGKPDYLDANTKITVDEKLKSYMTTYFREGGNNATSYVADNADIPLKEAADVWLNYFGGTTGAESVFAYYCYPANSTTEQIKAASKRACVVFPRAHAAALGDYSGVAVRLRYIDENGTLHSETDAFPAGTKIGFLLWNNAWKGGTPNDNNIFYSTKSLNSDGRSHTALFSARDSKGNRHNVISMEDWTDSDYNDVAFTIAANPRTSIELPPMPDPGENIKGTITYRGLLGYEDNWPKQGDYDMNDVVIKYVSTVTYNQDNMVVSVVDKFTLAWTGANYRNGFAYEVPFELKDTDVTPKSAVSGNVITLFSDAKSELGVLGISAEDMPKQDVREKDYTVSIEFNNRTIRKELVVPPYNPFIRVRNSNTEVHLTNNKPSPKADNFFPNIADISQGEKNGTYFICEDGFPFAIHMDARTNGDLMKLNLKPEGVHINETYPKFGDWAKTRDPNTKWW